MSHAAQGHGPRPSKSNKQTPSHADAFRGTKTLDVDDPRQLFLKFQTDSWMRYHGKHEHVEFTLDEKKKLRCYYDQMSLNHKSAGMAQVEDFFIAFGICESRREVLTLLPNGGEGGF